MVILCYVKPSRLWLINSCFSATVGCTNPLISSEHYSLTWIVALQIHFRELKYHISWKEDAICWSCLSETLSRELVTRSLATFRRVRLDVSCNSRLKRLGYGWVGNTFCGWYGHSGKFRHQTNWCLVRHQVNFCSYLLKLGMCEYWILTPERIPRK